MVTDQARQGLDSLELGAVPGDRGPARFARKAWTAGWPKLLAVALVLAIWEIVHLTGWKHPVLASPAAVLSDLWHLVRHGQLWAAIGVTMKRALIGYLVAMQCGSAVGLLVARIPPLRAALGSIITGLQTMPSIAWYPFARRLPGAASWPASWSCRSWTTRHRRAAQHRRAQPGLHWRHRDHHRDPDHRHRGRHDQQGRHRAAPAPRPAQSAATS
ncbi:MAG: ABC transporter permease [Streptosporangiaceae bacterium]